MTSIAVTRFNERIKLFAQTLMTAGAALSAWAAVRIYDRQSLLDPASLWLIVGVFAMYGAWLALGFLQED